MPGKPNLIRIKINNDSNQKKEKNSNNNSFRKRKTSRSDGIRKSHQIIAYYNVLNFEKGELSFFSLPSSEKESNMDQLRQKYNLSSVYFFADEIFYNNVADLNLGDSIQEFRSYTNCPEDIIKEFPIEKWDLCLHCKNEFSRKFYSIIGEMQPRPFCIHKMNDLAIFEIAMDNLPSLLIQKNPQCPNCGSFQTYQVDKPPIESYRCEKCQFNWEAGTN